MHFVTSNQAVNFSNVLLFAQSTHISHIKFVDRNYDASVLLFHYPQSTLLVKRKYGETNQMNKIEWILDSYESSNTKMHHSTIIQTVTYQTIFLVWDTPKHHITSYNIIRVCIYVVNSFHWPHCCCIDYSSLFQFISLVIN